MARGGNRKNQAGGKRFLINFALGVITGLTIFNAASSVYTLKIMTAVALLFVPVVIACPIGVYRVFRGKRVVEEVIKGPEAYGQAGRQRPRRPIIFSRGH